MQEEARQLALFAGAQRQFCQSRGTAGSCNQVWAGRGSDHPGHVLFPLFAKLLGGKPPADPPNRRSYRVDQQTKHSLPTPKENDLYELAGVVAPAARTTRTTMAKAMRTAAQKRAALITAKQHRHFYPACGIASGILCCAQRYHRQSRMGGSGAV